MRAAATAEIQTGAAILDVQAHRYNTASSKRIEPVRALTGVRGIAAWWVVAYHFRDALPGSLPAPIRHAFDDGYLAVDLFFILSGYVIAVNYAAWFAQEDARAALYGRFLALRLSRIYPLHLLILLLFLLTPLATLVVAHRLPSGSLHLDYLLLSFPLLQGWGLVDGPQWNVPAWSISVEWLAYLVFPWLAWCLGRLGGTQVRIACLALVFGLTLAVIARHRQPGALFRDFQYFGVARCLLEFSMGICACQLLALRSGRARPVLAQIVALACFTAFALAPSLEYAVLPLGFLALVYGLATEAGWLSSVLRAPAIQWLGLVSYSTYMSHYLLKGWVKWALLRPGIPPSVAFVAYLLAVLAASFVLHMMIERPGQRVCRNLLAARRGRQVS